VTARADLDARYGRGIRDGRRQRVLAIVAAAVGLAVVVAWVVWGGLLGEDAALEFRDIGHQIVDDSLVRVDFEVTADAGAEVGCAVQALNEGFTVVGWKVIELPGSDQRTRRLSEDVRTTELAVTGLIYRCWLL